MCRAARQLSHFARRVVLCAPVVWGALVSARGWAVFVCARACGSGDVESGTDKSPTQKNLRHGMWAVMTEAFTLTFLAEWGDRSQIATIALAAAKDPYGGVYP
jgi:putative Ca2+/H+ antiporter (TMEM165/GDT1 family)